MPQRQITAQVEAQELPDLTEQQREFVRLRLAGKTASDAYRGAYSADGMSQRALWCEASRVNANANVALWLSAARQAHLGTAVLTRDQHMQELESIREGCKASGNWGAALGAEVARGKVAGHQVESVRDVTERHEPADMLRELQQTSPSIAEALAKEHGIELPTSATKH